ncbi:MAG: DMT family transporter, partial [Thaumarchaeota archaeon]|nr:DMT family transporter [Nitrososphaerota archaeon]
TLSSAILFGSAYPIIQLSLRFYDAFTISLYRAILAAMVLLLYILVTKKKIQLRRRDVPYLVLASVLGASGFWTLLNESVLYLEPDTASFLTSLYSLIAVVLAALVLHEKMNVTSAVGVALGVFGTIVIVALGEKANFAGSSPVLGSIIAIVSAFSWSGYMITSRYLVGRKSTSGEGTSPEYVTFYTFLFAIPFTVIAMLLTSSGRYFLNSSPNGISYMLYLGIAVSGIAFLIFNKGMQLIGITGAAINQLLFPAISVILSFFIFGETINLYDLAGMSMIVIGILSAQVFSRRQV